jgi:hypothetical protein
VPADATPPATGLFEGTAIQTSKATTTPAATTEDALLAADARPSHRRN